MKTFSAIMGLLAFTTLGACLSIGDEAYDEQAFSACDEIFDEAAASECRLDEVAARQDRRAERHEEREKSRDR